MNDDVFALLRQLNPVDESTLPVAPPFAPPVERARRRLPISRVGAAFAAALIIAPAAYAVGPNLFNDFFGKPAPAPVRQSLTRWDEELRGSAMAGMPVHADAASTSGVARLATADGSVYLWRASESGGAGECLLIQYGESDDVSNVGASCDNGPQQGTPEVSMYYTAQHPLLVVAGRIPGATSVSLESSTGSTSAEVVDGYFLLAAPVAGEGRQLVAHDSRGAVIATRDVPPLPAIQAHG